MKLLHNNRRGRPRKSAQPSDFIRRTLRLEIEEGRLLPQDRLPTRLALMRRFGVTSNTVNAVLQDLKRDGFVTVLGRGTFVAERPPHLSRYAVVFRGHPRGPVPQNWSNYWTLIEQEARKIGLQRDLDVVSYYDITRHTDEPDYQRLVRDAAAGRLAGIFSIYPLGSDFSYDFTMFKGPMVAVTESAPAHTYALDNDRWGLIVKAVRRFAARGRRRVAWIGETQHEGLRTRLGTLLVNGRPASALFPDDIAVTLNATSQETAEPLVRLLLRQTPAYRPDGLLIMDDHLVGHAMRGLAGTGVRIPEDLDIVSHCNYPAVPSSPVPIRWLGFDATDLVVRAFNIIREGRVPQAREIGRKAYEAGATHLLPALWEDEWKGRAAVVTAEPAVARG